MSAVDREQRLRRAAQRAAPMLALASLCFIASRFTEFDTQELLVGVSVVFAMLGLTSAVFTWFDRR